MSNQRLDKLVWVAIYGGLILLMIGLWSGQGASTGAGVLVWIGGALVVIGAVLIWWRSRRPEESTAVDEASK